MIGITVLGATGSIGVSTLDVLARHPEQYRVIALTGNRQVERLYEQCLEHHPHYAVMADPASAEQLQTRLKTSAPDIEVLSGVEALEKVASLAEVDYVMAAIVGAAGLRPSIAAAEAGKRVLLANKEALVMSGRIFMDAIRENDAVLLPIDSEHNAIFQCMPSILNHGLEDVGVRKILLTASGGPFRETPLEQLQHVSPAQAISHPNWNMGKKISVDSATMMNKGLEVIEACWLFNTDTSKIEVVLHPQSIIHSMVEYVDGSVLAQLGNPDMRTPIAHALAWPKRMESGVSSLDLVATGNLDFQSADFVRFPCLRLAFDAFQAGGTAPAILNAANEVAVAAFLEEQITFTDIPYVIESTLSELPTMDVDCLSTVLKHDELARLMANEIILKRAS